MPFAMQGVFAAVLTPLDGNMVPDHDGLVRHCQWLLTHGCDGLSVLGTTGEANSFTVDERIAILDSLAEAGIPGQALMPGTGCCAVPDTVRLTRKALDGNAAGVLMLPPFYYKNVSDVGLFGAFADVIEGVGDDRLRVFLYHFPQMSGVPLGPRLIERLLRRYPQAVAGMKDSSGDLDSMVTCARTFPGFAVFSGSDELLWPLLQQGGAGCITAVCNVAAFLAAEVVSGWRRAKPQAARRSHTLLESVRQTVYAYPLTAALKAIMERHTHDPAWANIRPPLVPLGPGQRQALFEALDRLGFRPPPAP